MSLWRRSGPTRADIEDEVRSHLELHVGDQVAAGASPDEARRAALKKLGSVSAVADQVLDSQARPLDGWWRDLTLAVRQLGRSPAFSLTVVATLAVGIAATSAMFSVARSALTTPLPYPQPERRVMLFSRWTAFEKTSVADQEIVDYRAMARTLSAVAGWQTRQQSLTGDGRPQRVTVGDVTANTFHVLGIGPQIGQLFTDADDRPQAPPVAVLSDGLWRSRYGADPSVLGRTLVVDDVPVRIVGVMPPGFRLPSDYTDDVAEPSQLWRPLQIDARRLSRSHGYYAAAVLAAGQSPATATAELDAIAQALTRQGAYRADMRFTAFAVPFDEEIRGPWRSILWLLTGGVGCLLLIACANVSNLLLVRGDARLKELAVRVALGAARGQLWRQLSAEGLVLACAGTLAAVPAAAAGLALLTSSSVASLEALGPVTLDWTMVTVSWLLATVTTVVFSVAPLLSRGRRAPAAVLRDASGQSTAAPARVRARRLLILTEVGVATALLVGAGLMLRSLQAMQRVELGFAPEHMLTMHITLPESRYRSPEQTVDFYRRLNADVRALPGVRAAGVVRLLPLASTIGDWGLDVDGYDETTAANAKGDWQIVTDGAFEAMGTRLVGGRWFTERDRADSPPVAVVNETLARTYWRDPSRVIGGRLRLGSDPARPWATVVGIVADERHNGITAAVKEKFYIPHSQWHVVTRGNVVRNAYLVVRTDGDPQSVAQPVSRLLSRLDADLPISSPRAMTTVVADAMAAPRLTGRLLAIFASCALLLAGVGLYAVLAYSVTRRTREIGIRLALGSHPSDVLRLVVGQGLTLAAIGVGAGGAIALVGSRLLGSLLYQVRPADPQTFVTVAGVLLAVSLLAGLVPGLRAARLDPVLALRQE